RQENQDSGVLVLVVGRLFPPHAPVLRQGQRIIEDVRIPRRRQRHHRHLHPKLLVELGRLPLQPRRLIGGQHVGKVVHVAGGLQAGGRRYALPGQRHLGWARLRRAPRFCSHRLRDPAPCRCCARGGHDHNHQAQPPTQPRTRHRFSHHSPRNTHSNPARMTTPQNTDSAVRIPGSRFTSGTRSVVATYSVTPAATGNACGSPSGNSSITPTPSSDAAPIAAAESNAARLPRPDASITEAMVKPSGILCIKTARKSTHPSQLDTRKPLPIATPSKKVWIPRPVSTEKGICRCRKAAVCVSSPK